jgi:hypothetical protein
MRSDLTVNTCVTVQGTCPMEYTVCGELVEFNFGGPRDGFHFAFDAEALRNLADLSAEAAARMDAAGAHG